MAHHYRQQNFFDRHPSPPSSHPSLTITAPACVSPPPPPPPPCSQQPQQPDRSSNKVKPCICMPKPLERHHPFTGSIFHPWHVLYSVKTWRLPSVTGGIAVAEATTPVWSVALTHCASASTGLLQNLNLHYHQSAGQACDLQNHLQTHSHTAQTKSQEVCVCVCVRNRCGMLLQQKNEQHMRSFLRWTRAGETSAISLCVRVIAPQHPRVCHSNWVFELNKQH